MSDPGIELGGDVCELRVRVRVRVIAQVWY